MSAPNTTPGPWHLCQHLNSVEDDAGCTCGYRGVIFGPEHNVAMAVCQPGHDPAPKGQEGTEPGRYPREVEIANAHLIAAAPDMYEALEAADKALTLEGFTVTHPVIIQITAALAKARGEVQP